MKTETKNQKMKLDGVKFVLVTALLLMSAAASAQEQKSRETLINPDAKVTELLVPEFKLNSIQGDIGTLIGVYGGPMINNTFLIGACGGVNLGHPRVNYGYFGGICQYIFRSEELVHLSSQMVVAYGETKDYENPKSGPLDNFWNISGANFLLIEPGINLEINLSSKHILVLGASYRYVSGLREDSEDISLTHVTNRDMSGVNFNIGLKLFPEKKVKK